MFMGFGGVGMFIWMLCQWFFLLLGVYLIIRWIKGPSHKNNTYDNQAIAIVRERLARGEISVEEYERIIKILTEGGNDDGR
ncbi:SHOCT domain-containing protein [Aneurinibacillus terranovensis]|uniref:SHOCT domain-containing protein n=1 Tax=Aneurinibacillus terranovensis TaxID=278991 RepID=UPI00041F4203|nr:hypothetical protein [Aneurinibacillus terranovensis]